MRTRRAVFLLLGLFLLLPPGSLFARAASYQVVDLSAGSGSIATGLHESGLATGLYFGAGGTRRAFVWRNGQFADAGTLGGIAQTFAINGDRVAVGYSVDSTGRQRAIRSRDGVVQDLGTLHRGVHAAANDINAAGWIVGMSQRRAGNQTFDRAALWRNGTVIDLGTFGGEFSQANALNDAGQVVGWAWTADRDPRAFRWSVATGMADLGTLGGETSVALGINGAGAVVGSSQAASGMQLHRAFLWTQAAGMQELPSPADAQDTVAVSLNGLGQIVGSALFFENDDFVVRALLWESGMVHVLDDLLAPGFEDWSVVQADEIGENGVIAAAARHAATGYRAVLLVPLPSTH
jgi:probable HAF family extracellular repeat protein